jgi:16S rRNA (cytidine1402-2'-O)-methyltransferase
MEQGILYIVSTPIGNLGDITYRGVDILNKAGLIACEDTRRTRVLLSHYNIHKPLTSYFEHNKIRKAQEIVKALLHGTDIALVSDAGTPGISDPGYRIIQEALGHAIRIIVVPGASACTAALSVSGLATDRFAFEGFLSPKTQARRRRLKQLSIDQRTIILYESPHRLLAALKDIHAVLGDIYMVCARELTKVFEEVRREHVSSLIAHYETKKPKGEFVLLFNTRTKKKEKQCTSIKQP